MNIHLGIKESIPTRLNGGPGHRARETKGKDAGMGRQLHRHDTILIKGGKFDVAHDSSKRLKERTDAH